MVGSRDGENVVGESTIGMEIDVCFGGCESSTGIGIGLGGSLSWFFFLLRRFAALFIKLVPDELVVEVDLIVLLDCNDTFFIPLNSVVVGLPTDGKGGV